MWEGWMQDLWSNIQGKDYWIGEGWEDLGRKGGMEGS